MNLANEFHPVPKNPPKEKVRRRIPKKNTKRAASEFKRCYHSKERVEFVKALPCLPCTKWKLKQIGLSENAHTRTDGYGRKADYTKIVPMCHEHHRQYDEREGILGDRYERAVITLEAQFVEKLWLASQESAGAKRG